MTRLPNLDDYDNNVSDDDPADTPSFHRDRDEIPYADDTEETD